MDNGHAVAFAEVCGDALYFQDAVCQVVDDMEFEADTFLKSDKTQCCYIKNTEGYLLVVDDDQLQFKDEDSGCSFTIRTYRHVQPCCPQLTKEGRAITLSSYTEQHQQKAVLLVCSSENEVHPETIDVPTEIENTGHEALFFLKNVHGHTNKYMMQSSRYTSRYLGFETDGRDPPLLKLVLRESPTVETDNRVHFKVVPTV